MTLVSLVMRLGPVLSAVYASLLLLVSSARRAPVGEETVAERVRTEPRERQEKNRNEE